MLQPYLDDPGVQTEAALAVIAITPALVTTGHAAAIRRSLEKIVLTTKDPDVRRQAEEMARGIPPKTQN